MYRKYYCTKGCGNYLMRTYPGNDGEFVCPECRDIEEMDQLDTYWTTHPPQETLVFDLPEPVHAQKPKE